jgi:hypothetical protein
MPEPEAAALLDVRSRPGRAQAIFIIIVALLSGAGGFWLTQALDAAVRPGWPLALGIGVGIAGGVVLFAFQGARVQVDATGVLVYSLHGRPNLSLPVRQITAVRVIDQGLVRGVGLEVGEVAQIRFLHKMGISPARMLAWREQQGVDLILEGFGPDLADRLAALVGAPKA